MQKLEVQILKYIKSELLGAKVPKELNAETKLISSGLLDSLAVMQLVLFLEGHCKIKFEAYEIDRDNLDQVVRMLDFIKRKKA